MRKGQDGSNAAWLIAMIALFIVVYIILIPEAEKEKIITQPDQVGEPTNIYPGGSSGRGSGTSYYRSTQGTLLLSETPGLLYPYGRSLFVKPFASVNLFSTEDKREEHVTSALQLKSNFFTGDSKTYNFVLQDPRTIAKLQLLSLLQTTQGSITIKINGQEVHSGPLTLGDLPINVPLGLLQRRNTITFSVGSGILGSNHYRLGDVSFFITAINQNAQELRDFVLTRTELQNLEGLTMFYFVNCFTLQEQGTLHILLNGNVLSQQLIVCDAGEVSQDLPLSQLIPGRNVLDFRIDTGKYILEQISLEGNAGQGRIPNYFFTLQVEDFISGIPIGMDLKFFDDFDRKVATIYINGFPLYLDTPASEAFFELTPYVIEGQNVIKIIPETELDVVDLSVFIG